MNGLAESVADRGPDSFRLGNALLNFVRAITGDHKVARLLNVRSEACAR